MDPWRFPADADGHEAPSDLIVKRYVQQTVDEIAHAARRLSVYSEASVSALLLSPLLERNGQRPLLVRLSATKASSSPCASPAAAAALGGVALSARLPSLAPSVARPAPGTAKPFYSVLIC